MDAKALLDSLDVGVAAVAPDWTIAEWSAGASRVTGLPASQAQGRNFWMAFSAAKGSEIEHVLHSVLADGKARTCLMPAHASHTPGAVLETRSEEHTSELQSQSNLVCRLLLEKKKTECTHYHLPRLPPPSSLSAPCPRRTEHDRASRQGPAAMISSTHLDHISFERPSHEHCRT